MYSLISNIKFSFRHQGVRRSMILVVITTFIFSICLFVFWYPAVTQQSALQQELNQLRSKLVSVNKLNDLSNEYYAIGNTLAAVEKTLNSKTSLAEYTRSLYTLADDNNIKIMSLISKSKQIKQKHKVHYQELILQGKYKALRHFILDLRDAPRWTLINEVRLKKKKGSDDLIAELTIATYQSQVSVHAKR